VAVVTPLNNPGGPEGDTVTVEQCSTKHYELANVGSINRDTANLMMHLLGSNYEEPSDPALGTLSCLCILPRISNEETNFLLRRPIERSFTRTADTHETSEFRPFTVPMYEAITVD
jgi:hypothetical protein